MLERLLEKKIFSKKDIVFLLNLYKKDDLEKLYKKADEIRKLYCGDEVHLRGIIEISNICEQNCLYCGLRCSNKNLIRYKMSSQEIIAAGKKILKAGIKTIILQSGENKNIKREEISEIIYELKSYGDCAITLSLGERDFIDYAEWRKAGAERYLLKHETASRALYSLYHPGENLIDRIKHLRMLKILRYQIGSGNLIGLPQQTLEDIADDILLCDKLDIDMGSFSPLIPPNGYPLKSHAAKISELTLKVIAAARIVLKKIHIPVTTALSSIDPDARERGLNAGGNVIMINFTPNPYNSNYIIYPNRRVVSDQSAIINLLSLTAKLGRHISESKGNSPKLRSSAS
jgi:biotin synthase